MLRHIMVDIKREKTPAHAWLKRTAKGLLRWEVPVPDRLYAPLYWAHVGVGRVREHVARTLYYQPMFRSRCERVGRGLYMYQGLPYIDGDLRLRIGDSCKISAQTSLVAGHVCDAPTLTLGDHTNLGPGVVISVGRAVTLGSHVRIGSGVYITDNPGHPMDARERRGQAIRPEDAKEIVIEDDVWVCTDAKVMPGVRIGRGSIVAAGSIVTRDVPPGCVVAGAPARIIRWLDGSEASRASSPEAVVTFTRTDQTGSRPHSPQNARPTGRAPERRGAQDEPRRCASPGAVCT